MLTNFIYTIAIGDKFFFTSDHDEFVHKDKIYKPGLIIEKIPSDSISVKFSDTYFDIVSENFSIDEIEENSRIIVNITDKKTSFSINFYNGYVSSIEVNEVSKLRIFTSSIFQKLNKTIGNFFSQTCRNNFGDSNCKMNIDNFSTNGTILDVINKSHFIGNHKQFLPSYFQFGILKFTSGENINSIFYIKDNTNPNEISFFYKGNKMISIGDRYILQAGCDKTLNTCKNKFKNVINFGGEPFIN